MPVVKINENPVRLGCRRGRGGLELTVWNKSKEIILRTTDRLQVPEGSIVVVPKRFKDSDGKSWTIHVFAKRNEVGLQGAEGGGNAGPECADGGCIDCVVAATRENGESFTPSSLEKLAETYRPSQEADEVLAAVARKPGAAEVSSGGNADPDLLLAGVPTCCNVGAFVSGDIVTVQPGLLTA